MRDYGRTYDVNGNYKWVVIYTDTSGFSDYVYITAIIQTFKLNLGESPFWANYGIPAKQSVQQQVPPDYYVANIQQFYSSSFANITVSKIPNRNPAGQASTGPIYSPPNVVNTKYLVPTYFVSIVRTNGSLFQMTIGL